MFEYLYQWVENIAFYLVIITMAVQMIPNNEYKKYVRFFTGLVLILLLLAPVLKVSGMDYTLKELLQSERYQKEIERMEHTTEYLKQFSPEEETEIGIGEIQIEP